MALKKKHTQNTLEQRVTNEMEKFEGYYLEEIKPNLGKDEDLGPHLRKYFQTKTGTLYNELNSLSKRERIDLLELIGYNLKEPYKSRWKPLLHPQTARYENGDEYVEEIGLRELRNYEPALIDIADFAKNVVPELMKDPKKSQSQKEEYVTKMTNRFCELLHEKLPENVRGRCPLRVLQKHCLGLGYLNMNRQSHVQKEGLLYTYPEFFKDCIEVAVAMKRKEVLNTWATTPIADTDRVTKEIIKDIRRVAEALS